ncbi:MAG: hypothetical protein Q9223_002985 [Gallowayella weberi]
MSLLGFIRWNPFEYRSQVNEYNLSSTGSSDSSSSIAISPCHVSRDGGSGLFGQGLDNSRRTLEGTLRRSPSPHGFWWTSLRRLTSLTNNGFGDDERSSGCTPMDFTHKSADSSWGTEESFPSGTDTPIANDHNDASTARSSHPRSSRNSSDDNADETLSIQTGVSSDLSNDPHEDDDDSITATTSTYLRHETMPSSSPASSGPQASSVSKDPSARSQGSSASHGSLASQGSFVSQGLSALQNSFSQHPSVLRGRESLVSSACDLTSLASSQGSEEGIAYLFEQRWGG